MKKYALVTGCDHGVGLALAEQLLERKYYVIACRVNPLETQIDTLADRYPNQIEILKLDISQDESVDQMKEAVEFLVPHLDLVFNVAGILGDMDKVLGEKLNFDEMLQVFNVNALGALRVTNALFDLIKKGSGKTVVNISSEAGSIGDCWREGWFGYCMSKAANNMQTALVHNNLRKEGGRVIAMHPGHVATYMRGHLDTTAKITPEQSAEGILKVVLERMELSCGEHPDYVDYEGNLLVW